MLDMCHTNAVGEDLGNAPESGQLCLPKSNIKIGPIGPTIIESTFFSHFFFSFSSAGRHTRLYPVTAEIPQDPLRKISEK